MTRQHPPTPTMTRHLSRDRGRGKKGVTCHFSKCSLIKDYFKMLISHNRHAKLAPSLLQCQSSLISFLRSVRRENVSDIGTRQMDPPFSVDHTTFYRQHLCGRQCTREQSQPQQDTWNSKLFVIFPLKILLHTVYIVNIFLWTEVIDLRSL
jgi:hypothetical protein